MSWNVRRTIGAAIGAILMVLFMAVVAGRMVGTASQPATQSTFTRR